MFNNSPTRARSISNESKKMRIHPKRRVTLMLALAMASLTTALTTASVGATTINQIAGLKAHSLNTYVRATATDGAKSDVMKLTGESELFIIDNGDGTVHIKSIYGKYLSMGTGARTGLSFKALTAGVNETFTIVTVTNPSGYIELYTANGYRACAWYDGKFFARPSCGALPFGGTSYFAV
jgi:hypothetical protein